MTHEAMERLLPTTNVIIIKTFYIINICECFPGGIIAIIYYFNVNIKYGFDEGKRDVVVFTVGTEMKSLV